MKKAKQQQPDKNSLSRLKAIMDECWSRASDQNIDAYTWADIAGVHVNTLLNLAHGFTRFPRFQTVVMLAKAVGLEVTLEMKRKKRTHAA